MISVKMMATIFPPPTPIQVQVNRMGSGQKADVLRILIAILLPPLGVFLEVGLGLHFWINLILTFLGYIPGIIHAVWIIVMK